jgi:hypothetical protein
MRRIGWWLLLLAGAVASACQGTKAVPEGSAGSSGSVGNGGSAESSGNGGQLLLGISGSLGTGGVQIIDAPSEAGRAPVDLSTVVAPLVRCHGMDGTGGQAGQAGNGNQASGGEATRVAPEGGAGWDDDCAPPPSQCADNWTLVYFDQGECVEQRCTWQKLSLTCVDGCGNGGCSRNITR